MVLALKLDKLWSAEKDLAPIKIALNVEACPSTTLG